MSGDPEDQNGVTRVRETATHVDYEARMFHIRLSDKSIVRMAEKQIDSYEVVVKRARIMKDVTIPAPQELSQYYAADLEVLTTAVSADVEAKRHTL